MSLASRKLIQATAGATTVDTGDDDFANVVLLLDGDGTSDDNNNTFTDSGSVGATITENGSVVQGSFSPYGDNWSNYFDGSSYLKLPSDATHAFGTGDYTIDCWIYPQNVSSASPIIFQSGPHTTANVLWMVYGTTYGGLTLGYTTGGAGGRILTNTQPIQDAWNHIGISRASGTTYIYLNGQQIASSTLHNGINLVQNGPAIGVETSLSTHYFKGYISNFRSIKGTALYTSSFTPPTEPLTAITNTSLLTCQSNRFIDNSSNGHTITVNGTPKVTPFSPFKDDDARDITTDGGSVLFGPSGDYLQLPSNSAYNATSSLCVECWFYMVGAPGAESSAHAPISRWASTTAGQRAWLIDIENTGVRMRVDTATNSSNVVVVDDSTGALNQYAWYHIALTWDGSTYRGFLNGELIGSLSDSNAPRGTSQVIRVGYNQNSHYMDGYVSDCRVLVDQGAVYTSAFTPPTAPLGSFGANTPKLLLNFQDAGIYDRSGINNLDTIGNAQIDTAVKKYGTGSLEFDGTGDYLQTVAGSEPLYFTGQDFTVEGWVYLNNLSSNHTCFYYGDTNRSTSNASGIAFEVFYRSSDGYFRANQYYSSTGGFGGSNTLVTPAATQWYHVAYYRIGSQFYLAVNGNVANIGNFTQDLQNASDWVFRVGKESDSIGNEMDGFMDDVRVTMGKARYGTSNFTPPDAALPKF